MILIGGRIFVIFWPLIKFMPILVNIEGYRTYRHITRVRNVDKTRPACEWDDDSGW